MTQFSFEWILSLNWLCQEWGQVQFGTHLLTNAADGGVSKGVKLFSAGVLEKANSPAAMIDEVLAKSS
jgi:hypothetical protein